MKYSGDYLSKLLLTRLKRSLFRTKARVITVMILITLSSYAGVSFAEYNRNMKSVYIDFYAETNLADLIISDSEQPEENFSRICQEYEDWLCESRLKLSGQTQFTNDTGTHWISSVWYGITSNQVSRLYMIEGELAEKKNEVVIDAHFADAHELVIGDTLTIGAGFGMHEVNISGIANNPLHLWYSPEGSLFPDAANFVVGYFDASYLAEISGFDSDVRNELHIDLPGTPNFDISSTTDIDEGEALNPIKEQLSKELADHEMSGVIVDRSGMSSPELLRVDLEGSQKSTPFILAILLLISGLVIAVSIDRLVKSQSREIAVLRTVGASSKQIMSGYLLVPSGSGNTKRHSRDHSCTYSLWFQRAYLVLREFFWYSSGKVCTSCRHYRLSGFWFNSIDFSFWNQTCIQSGESSTDGCTWPIIIQNSEQLAHIID